MDILDILRQAQGGAAVTNLARAYGVDPAAAEAVLKSVVPELSQRIERNTLSRGGVADLIGAIGAASDRAYLDHPKALASDAVKADGVAYLDQILGSKDKSRTVAYHAAQTTGLSEALIKQMLPTIAAMMMGGLAKGIGGGLGDILSKIPGLPGAPAGGGNGAFPRSGGGGDRGGQWGQEGQWGQGSGGGPMPMPGEARTAPTGGGDFSGQAPLPIPGNARPGSGGGNTWGGDSGHNPYGDLSDIIRRGGQSVPGAGGGALANIIRSILGAVLGFQSRGVLSWIMRYVVLRYGMNIVRWFFSRLLLGRRV